MRVIQLLYIWQVASVKGQRGRARQGLEGVGKSGLWIGYWIWISDHVYLQKAPAIFASDLGAVAIHGEFRESWYLQSLSCAAVRCAVVPQCPVPALSALSLAGTWPLLTQKHERYSWQSGVTLACWYTFWVLNQSLNRLMIFLCLIFIHAGF